MNSVYKFAPLFLTVFCLSCTQKQTGKTFVYCSEGSPATFNPQLVTDGPTLNASSRQVYNRLVEFESGGTKTIPSLAKEWSANPQDTEFTFKLRDDVEWQTTDYFKPTRKFNADDVIFSFDRMRLKDHPYHMVGGGNYEIFVDMEMAVVIKDIVKIDDYTVKFILVRPEAPFIANLAMDFASILSKEYADQLAAKNQKDKIDSEPVGTGPFVFKRYDKDNMIRYESHPKYFLGKAKIDKLVFAITPDASVRFQKLKAGECHFIAEPSPSDLQAMKGLSNVKIISAPGLNLGYLTMNVQKKPFDNEKVRKAVYLALNRTSYIDAIYYGNAVVAKNPLPPAMWSYNDDIKDYEYSVEGAKKLLTEAGFPKGFETELWTLPVSRPYIPNGKKMGELMQADLAKIGIKAKLVTYDWPTYLAKARKGEQVMMQIGWTSDNGDPDNFLNVLLGCAAAGDGGSNYSRWCDQEFQKLVTEARQSPDVLKRTELYRKSQEIFHRAVPYVPLAHSTVFKAMSSKVVGYQISPFGWETFYPVDLQ